MPVEAGSAEREVVQAVDNNGNHLVEAGCHEIDRMLRQEAAKYQLSITGALWLPEEIKNPSYYSLEERRDGGATVTRRFAVENLLGCIKDEDIQKMTVRVARMVEALLPHFH